MIKGWLSYSWQRGSDAWQVLSTIYDFLIYMCELNMSDMDGKEYACKELIKKAVDLSIGSVSCDLQIYIFQETDSME